MSDLQTVPTEVANRMTMLATELAGKESKEMSDAVAEIVNAKESWEGGPIAAMVAMGHTYGNRMADFPHPDAVLGTNPAKFKSSVIKTDGTKVSRTVDWYVLFADSTKEGLRYTQELEWCKRLKVETDNHEGIPPEFVKEYGDSIHTITERQDFIKRRQSVIRNAYRKAMALYHQLERVNSFSNSVSVEILWVSGKEEEQARNLAKPIVVYDMASCPSEGKPPERWRYFSVGSFLRLDVSKAEENGANYEALIATVQRDSNKGAAGSATSQANPQLVRTPDTFAARMNDIHEYLDVIQSKTDTADWQALQKAIDGPGSDDLFLSLWSIRDTLNQLLGGDRRAVRHEKLMQESDAAAA